MATNVVQGKDLAQQYRVGRGNLRALDGVSFELESARSLAIVGESGCGKSTLGKIIAGIVEPTQGSVYIEGENLSQASKTEAIKLRLSVQVVQQDVYSSLNPRRRVSGILCDPMVYHRIVRNRKAAADRAAELLDMVGLSPASDFLQRFSYQMSGGQRQRVAIARALCVNPKIVVADEAVSMIDMSLRSSILNIFQRLQDDMGIAYMFITHDVALARYFARDYRTMVMYAGKVIELGPTEAVVDHPLHPYTRMLCEAVPDPDPANRHALRLVPKASDLPDLTQPDTGCRFRARCPFETSQCSNEVPILRTLGEGGHWVACHHAEEWPGMVDQAEEA